MNDYEFEVRKSLSVTGNNFQFRLKLLRRMSPLSREALRHRIDEGYEGGLCFNSWSQEAVFDFVEDKIGEDFVVFPSMGDLVFCIHEVDDFLTDQRRSG